MFALAMIAPVGAGILFLFGLLAIGLVAILWIGFWTAFRFRHRTTKDPRQVRKNATIFLVFMMTAMLLFPPLAEVGVWRPAEPFDPLISERDRGWFGFIPSYRWIGETLHVEPTPANVTTNYDGRALLGKRLQIDWYFLVGQWGLLWIGCLPYLRTVSQE